MDIKTLCTTLQPLLDLSREVTETNFQFQTLLVNRIQQTGKPVDQLTVAEVQQLADDATAEYQARINQ